MLVLLYMNLIFGTFLASQTNLNHKSSFNGGKNDYKLWLTVIAVSLVLVVIDMVIVGFRVSCQVFPLQPSIIFMMITFILFCLTMYHWIRIHKDLKNLDSSTTNQFDITNLKKLYFYILVYLIQWVSFK